MPTSSETELNPEHESPGGDVPGLTECSVDRREYAAPQRHGEMFVEPSFDQAPELIEANGEAASSYGPLLNGLRSRARTQLVADAIRYSGVYCDVSWAQPNKTSPIIMAGHQPTLFHPGVWFKNFALSHLATLTDALAINLVVDNDVASGSSIRVPTWDSDSATAQYRTVAYDEAGGGVPYEQTTISDREKFDAFDREVEHAIGPLVADPCVGTVWKHAKAAVQRCGVAGCALAQARHGLEAELGLRTLEIPLGVACRGSAFAEFVLAILTELPRFRSCYNESADQYRKVHGIRSSAHPVPNLAQQDDWFESPLWIYGNDAPTRRPVWVRWSNDHLVISDTAGGGGDELRIDVRHPKLAAEQLASAASPNLKLRPRALLTTMYARLILSDLFLHGIGGAKYDQLGDQIMQSFFGVTPPKFMVVSATIKLPGTEGRPRTQDIQFLKRQIRDTEYQPERFADRAPLDPKLIERKRQLLNTIPASGQKKAWHDEISRINTQLSRSLEDLRGALLHDLSQAQRDAASRSLLSSREHPFCLFPLDYLKETYEKLLA